MGQVLRPDYIPQLVKNTSTQIGLPSGSWFTLGGQQYYQGSDLSVGLSMSANTLYFVYLVRSGGVNSLVYSVNPNSIGPAGYSLWKLVGAFYSNGLTSVVFGSFVNIEGTPITSVISHKAVFGGCGTITSDEGTFYFRNGDIIEAWGTAVTGTCDGNPFTFQLPGSLTFDSAKLATTPDTNRLGFLERIDGTVANQWPTLTNGPWVLFSDTATSANKVYLSVDSLGSRFAKNSATVLIGNTKRFHFWFRGPITDWSNTPLRFL